LKSSNDRRVSGESLIIAEIVGVHGLQGVVKLRSYSDARTLFEPGRRLHLENSDGQVQTLAVAWAKPHGKGMLLAIEGVTERGAAEALIGSCLSVDKAALPDLDDGTYYWFELIGVSVYTTQGRYLGTLESILPTGSNDVYVVRNGDEEILLPALASVVQVIDTDQRRMEVILPEGL
jgi:16S rRNA processing protein RimM